MVATTSINSTWGEDYFVLSLQETLGVDTLNKILHYCGGKASQKGTDLIQPVTQTMKEMFGLTGTRGLLVCSGRAAFKYFLKQEGKRLGFDTTQFRLLPTRTKLKKGLQQIAFWMQESSGEVITIVNEDKHWIYQVASSEKGTHELTSSINCDFMVGLLQEFLAWAGGGKFYRVKEASCRAAGADCCSFVIDKFPLE